MTIVTVNSNSYDYKYKYLLFLIIIIIVIYYFCAFVLYVFVICYDCVINPYIWKADSSPKQAFHVKLFSNHYGALKQGNKIPFQ